MVHFNFNWVETDEVLTYTRWNQLEFVISKQQFLQNVPIWIIFDCTVEVQNVTIYWENVFQVKIKDPQKVFVFVVGFNVRYFSRTKHTFLNDFRSSRRCFISIFEHSHQTSFNSLNWCWAFWVVNKGSYTHFRIQIELVRRTLHWYSTDASSFHSSFLCTLIVIFAH